MPIGKYIPFGVQTNTDKLANVSRNVLECEDIDVVLQTILEEAVRVCNGVRGFLAIVDHDHSNMDVRYTTGPDWTEEKRKGRLRVSEETGQGITSHVAACGKAYRSPNVSEDPYYMQYFDDVRSEIAVPLLDGMRVRGVVNIDSTTLNAFNELHEYIVSNLCDLAAIAMTLSDYRLRESAMMEIGLGFDGFSDPKELVEKVMEVTSDVLKFEDCSVFLLNKQTKKLCLVAPRGILADLVGMASYDIGQGLTGWTAKEKKCLRLIYPHKDPRWSGCHKDLSPDEISAFMAVPICNREGVVGVIRLQRKKSIYPWFTNEFTVNDETVLASIAGQLGMALENSELVDKLIKSERMAAWGELSARSAHMIGNRVFAIKGDINELEYLLNKDEIDKDEILDLLENTNKGIFLLEEILNEFRLFVKANQLDLVKTDLNKLVLDTVKDCFPKRSSVSVNVKTCDELEELYVDPTKLSRAISELMENATNFMPSDGVIDIAILATPERSSGKYLKKKKKVSDFVMIKIADNGKGVAEDEKAMIFTPFYTSRSKGMGLGLPIVQGVIEGHGGVVFENGTEGKGAVFNILLPKGEKENVKNTDS